MRTRFGFLILPLLSAAALAACAPHNNKARSNDGGASASTSGGNGETVTTIPNPDGGAPIQVEPGTMPPSPGTLNITSETLDVNGSPRAFLLVTPSTYDASRSYPLILALHGDGGSGSQMQGSLHFEDASGQNAIVVYPTGSNSGWDLYDPSSTNADVMFITNLVTSLRARFTIDSSHVFGIGMSSGAFMVNQLACRQSQLFRGIVSHSGGAPSEPRDPGASTWGNGFVKCAGQTNPGPAAMVMHGTADTMVPFGSGEYTASYWASVNGCGATRAPSPAAPPCAVQESCPAAHPVVFCAIENLGHSIWPSAPSTAWGFFSGL